MIVAVIARLDRVEIRIGFVDDIDEIAEIRPFVKTQAHASLGGSDVAGGIERLKPHSEIDAATVLVGGG